MKVIKRITAPVIACRLGDGSEMERRLIASGALVRREDGSYEVFSREAMSGKGEVATAGSYVKLDSNGKPYPNSADFFLANHRQREDGSYYQIPRQLQAWWEGLPPCEEMEFLLRSGRIIIDRDHPERWYSAHLWGAWLSAARDAAIVFRDVARNAEGDIEHVGFAFVARDEFDKTYDVLEAEETAD